MDLTIYKEKLPDYLINYHSINPKKLFNCLNPNHEDRHPSMGYYTKRNICKCFSCGVSYDIFDLIKIDFGLDNFKDQLNKVLELYDSDKLKAYINNFEYKEEEIIDYSDYFSKCKLNINKTNYLEQRGINSNLIKKYYIGYDLERRQIIFPINKNSYFARGVDSSVKFKSKGISYLWNEELLKDNNNNLIYLTESIIDSLSLETIDPDVKTIALNGLPNYQRLLNIIEENNYKGYFVLAFDNDKWGLIYQQTVKNELAKLNIRSFGITLISNISEVKDLNEALITNKELLEKNYKYFDENLRKIIEEQIEREGDDIEL